MLFLFTSKLHHVITRFLDINYNSDLQAKSFTVAKYGVNMTVQTVFYIYLSSLSNSNNFYDHLGRLKENFPETVT